MLAKVNWFVPEVTEPATVCAVTYITNYLEVSAETKDLMSKELM